MSVLMPLLHSPRPDRASTAWHCPGSPRPRLPPGSGTLRPGQPGRPWRVWPGRTGPSHPVGRLPAPPPPPGTTDSPTHDSTPDPEPPPKPTHQPPHAPPHPDAHPDHNQSQTHNTPPRVVHPPPDPTEERLSICSSCALDVWSMTIRSLRGPSDQGRSCFGVRRRHGASQRTRPAPRERELRERWARRVLDRADARPASRARAVSPLIRHDSRCHEDTTPARTRRDGRPPPARGPGGRPSRWMQWKPPGENLRRIRRDLRHSYGTTTRTSHCALRSTWTETAPKMRPSRESTPLEPTTTPWARPTPRSTAMSRAFSTTA